MTESNPREELAEAFDRDLDPLAKFAATFEDKGIDAFEIYKEERLSAKDLADATVGEYNRTFGQWKQFMDRQGRHPVCPSDTHVKQFVQYQRDERGNGPGTIKNRLMYLNQAYQYWQDDAAFPHPQDYNPIDVAKGALNLEKESPKDPPRLTIEELRENVDKINHIRDRAIVALQLKLGLRASEVCNIKLSEVDIANHDVRNHYDQMGGATALEGRENALYIPHDRDLNKSQCPRVLPLDDELRRVLVRYLLIRPDNGEPWLFLTKIRRGQMQKQDVNPIWKDVFHPKYAETDEHRGITSHYGRHRFTTYWRVEEDLNRELIKYMRGDTAGSAQLDDMGAIDEYIHTYYEDIESLFRAGRIFKLSV